MQKRRTAQQIVRLLREADQDLAKGLTVLDVCRKLGIADATFYRWRHRHDSSQTDGSRQIQILQAEVDRLKELVAELALDKKMLQDITKKSGDC